MKFNIHKKVLSLVLGSGLMAMLVLGIFWYLGGKVVEKDMNLMSEELSVKSASYTDELLKEQIKQTLGELAKAKAQYIDREMTIGREGTEILSAAMSEIYSHPENYSPKTLLDPRNDTVRNGEPYIIYAPDLRNNVTPKIQNEIALAANISDILQDLLKTYEGYNATVFVGSEDGWHICGRLVVDKDGKTNYIEPLYFSHERIYDFDPRKRPWYINAKKADKPVISDLYRTIEADGYTQFGASAPFYDANGNFAGVVGIDTSNVDFYKIINETIGGEDNLNFVLNRHGEIIFSSRNEGELSAKDGVDLRNNSEKTLAQAAEKMISGESGVMSVKLNNENFYLAFAPMSESTYSFGMLISEEEILISTQGTRDYFLEKVDRLQRKLAEEYSYIRKFTLGIPVALLIILFFMSTALSRRFVKPINELSDGVREIASGNLDKKLDIHTGDEIEHLATCFNAMTDELKIYMENLTKVTAEKERIATELDVAKEIQNGMLPKDFPTRKDFELFATMTPAKEVGGDFYDFYLLDETHLAITVADVSGKGIPAALFMVISKTILNNFATSFYQRNGLAPVVSASNEKLCASNDAMMFVTAFVGVLDLETGEFTFVNAGHNPPVIYRAEKNSCEFLDVKKNFVMGPMDGIPFVEQKISFAAGDLIFIYTDGVTEALNVANEEYLPDRLIKFMNGTDCRVDLQTLLKKIRGDVAEHVGEAEQSDDITMFALRFNGGKS